jgi:hypothetical protein
MISGSVDYPFRQFGQVVPRTIESQDICKYIKYPSDYKMKDSSLEAHTYYLNCAVFVVISQYEASCVNDILHRYNGC